MSLEARFQLVRGAFILDAAIAFEEKGITALFGPSGAGKSTILRCLAGLEHAPGGFCRAGEQIWQDDARGVFLPCHRRSLGYMFQEVSLFPFLTVEQNLRYGWRRLPEGERRIQFEEAVEWLGLAAFLKRKPDGLSGGEKQRAGIARALLTSPQLLLMDEPLAALDHASKRDILKNLRRLPERFGIPVIYVSHSVDEVAQLADRIILLENGTVRASGILNAVLTRLDLPLSHQVNATAVLEARVTGHDDPFSLTRLVFAGGEVLIPRQNLPIGQTIRVAIHARDVSLALAPPVGSTILNVIPATIVELSSEGSGLMTLRLDASGIALLSCITRKSAETLNLQPGVNVFAQVKSVALLE